jgi:hypothetical protein
MPRRKAKSEVGSDAAALHRRGTSHARRGRPPKPRSPNARRKTVVLDQGTVARLRAYYEADSDQDAIARALEDRLADVKQGQAFARDLLALGGTGGVEDMWAPRRAR